MRLIEGEEIREDDGICRSCSEEGGGVSISLGNVGLWQDLVGGSNGKIRGSLGWSRSCHCCR